MLEDKEFRALYARAQNGDRDAENALFERFQGPLREWVSRRLGTALRTRFDSEDITQSAYVAAIRDLPGKDFENARAFFVWLRTIMGHKITEKADYLAAQRRNPGRESGDGPDPDEIDDGGETPSACVSRKEQAGILVADIGRLPDPLRAVARLSLEGFSTGEMATRVGKSEDAVRHLIVRARRRLAEMRSGRDADGGR